MGLESHPEKMKISPRVKVCIVIRRLFLGQRTRRCNVVFRLLALNPFIRPSRQICHSAAHHREAQPPSAAGIGFKPKKMCAHRFRMWHSAEGGACQSQSSLRYAWHNLETRIGHKTQRQRRGIIEPTSEDVGKW